VGYGIAKVHQQTIPNIFGQVALKAADHSSAEPLIREHYLAQLFGVELLGERS
jgi:hypothetical protein